MNNTLKKIIIRIFVEIIGLISCIPFLIVLDYYGKPTDPNYVIISMFVIFVYMAVATHVVCKKIHNKLKTKYSIQ